MNAGRWRSLGQLWMRRYERDATGESAQAAYAAFREAVQRYPHSAAAQAELASAAQQAGDPDRAQQAALAALRLDATNRERRHVDKFLSETQLADLRALVPTGRDDPDDPEK